MSQAQFDKAVAIIQALPKDGPVKPTQEDQLYFYQYFKQANLGDNTTTRPGMLDFTGKAKWDAWTSVKGTSKEEAREKYVAKLLEACISSASGSIDAHSSLAWTANFQILKKADDEASKKSVAEIEAA